MKKFCGSIADKVTDESIQLDVIVTPILPEASSNLDVAEAAESHVANVPTSSSLSDSVQNEQAGPSHSLQVRAATSADLGIVVQAAKGCWGTLRHLVSCQMHKECNILLVTPSLRLPLVLLSIHTLSLRVERHGT